MNTMSARVMDRVAYVEDDVPHELIKVAALIDYGAYSRTQLSDKLELLRSTVREKLQGTLRPRTPAERTKSLRKVPAHVPDDLLAIFNDYVFPQLNSMQKFAYKNGLELWVRSNLKIR